MLNNPFEAIEQAFRDNIDRVEKRNNQTQFTNPNDHDLIQSDINFIKERIDQINYNLQTEISTENEAKRNWLEHISYLVSKLRPIIQVRSDEFDLTEKEIDTNIRLNSIIEEHLATLRHTQNEMRKSTKMPSSLAKSSKEDLKGNPDFTPEKFAYIEDNLKKNPQAVKLNKKEHNLPYSIHVLTNPNDDKSIYYTTRVLGKGGFGTVRLAKELYNPERLAAIKFEDVSEKGSVSKKDIPIRISEVHEEQKTLQAVDQFLGKAQRSYFKEVSIVVEDMPEIASDFKATKEITKVITAMPFFAGENLEKLDALKQTNIQNIDMALSIALDLKKNVHDKGLVHCDIKGANIIWNAAKGSAKIIDFGRSGKIDEQGIFRSVTSATMEIMAPECFKGNKQFAYQYTKQSDVYALGLVLKEKFNLDQKSPLLSEDLLMRDFIENMISTEPNERPTLINVIDFFQTLKNKNENDHNGNMQNIRQLCNDALRQLEFHVEKKSRSANKLSFINDRNKDLASINLAKELIFDMYGLLGNNNIEAKDLKNFEQKLAHFQARNTKICNFSSYNTLGKLMKNLRENVTKHASMQKFEHENLMKFAIIM